MSQIERINDNLNVHQSLDDRPSMSASDLKKKWDEPANAIKTYINDTLLPGIETNNLELKTDLENKINDLKSEIGKDISIKFEEYSTEINNKILGMQNSINSIKTSVNGLIKTQTLSTTVRCDAYSGNSGLLGNLSIPSGYTFVGLLVKQKPINFVVSAGISASNGTAVSYTASNIHSSPISGTVTAVAMFIKI